MPLPQDYVNYVKLSWNSDGIKRVLYAEEDSVWYNTHKNPTNTEDVKKLEKDLVSISYEEYEEYIKNK